MSAASDFFTARHELLPGRLWQTGEVGTWVELLAQPGPWLVVSLVQHMDPLPPGVALYVHWPIADAELPDLATLTDLGEMIAQRLHPAPRWGGQVPQVWRVLVHCDAGENRSGLVCAEAMWWLGCGDGGTIYNAIRKVNPNALNNPTFARYVRGLPSGPGDRAR